MSGAGQTPRAPSRDPDVCVVGSGPAGAILANSLAGRGHEVVVLEAGPRFDPSERLERMETSIRGSKPKAAVWDMGGERDRFRMDSNMPYRLNLARVKGVGGSSLHWGGTVPRFHEVDFERESRYGYASDWPFSYEDLRPYYAAAEREIGVAGTDDSPFSPPREHDFPVAPFPPSYSDRVLTEACEDLGIEVHTIPRAQVTEPYDGRSVCLAYGTCKPVCPSGSKYDATIHVDRAVEKGVRVLDRAPVQRLEHDASGDRVTHAVYETPSGERFRQPADHFVVACGSVETARLLLLSDSETYPDGLANSSGQVGRNLMSHPYVTGVGRLDQQTGQNEIGFSTTMTHQFYENEGGRPGSIQIEFLNNAEPALGTLATAKSTILDDFLDLTATPDRLGVWQDLLSEPIGTTSWGDELLEEMRSVYGTHLGLTATVEMLPDPENRVTLHPRRTDDHGNPIPDVSIHTGEFAEETLSFAEERIHEILAATGAEEIATTRGWSPHQSGTARMGEDPATSVVDARLRAHDLDNLSIVGASVFPTDTAVNPTLTIVAISLRAADDLDTSLG
ncbi:GMC family oxidoreductase [Haloarchaeobius litoreus]|uniref:GMC family oxidoreductase n=1 Tax=Haloarchaeobius litoreus TaxID=755306 RepID=A0ABD6DN10_9EURY|nr:GMC family oxidoreductase [Haloarchaeobius litoreus]